MRQLDIHYRCGLAQSIPICLLLDQFWTTNPLIFFFVFATCFSFLSLATYALVFHTPLFRGSFWERGEGQQFFSPMVFR